MTKKEPDDVPLRNASTLSRYLHEGGVVHELYGDEHAQWGETVFRSDLVQEGFVFFGLQGAHTNGGLFLADALQRGASIAIVERDYVDKHLRHTFGARRALICVRDALQALSVCAANIRERTSATIIAVTGSAGKTTTTRMIAGVLDGISSRGNLNTIQGLCLSILNARWDKVRYGIFECGISEQGEMEVLAGIIKPDHVVLTNVGNAHVGRFPSIDLLQREKLLLASRIPGILWIPEEDEVVERRSRLLNVRVKKHGPENCRGFIRIVDRGAEGSILEFENGYKNITIPMLGSVNARNALTAIGIADFFSQDRMQTAIKLSECKTIPRRYQQVLRMPRIIDDAYNASTPAVLEALDWCAKQQEKKKIIVLAGMKELGVFSNEEHQKLADRAIQTAKKGDTTVIFLGEEFSGVRFPKIEGVQCVWVHDSVQAFKTVIGIPQSENAMIFVKGSNAYGLDEFVEKLLRHFSTAKNTERFPGSFSDVSDTKREKSNSVMRERANA